MSGVEGLREKLEALQEGLEGIEDRVRQTLLASQAEKARRRQAQVEIEKAAARARVHALASGMARELRKMLDRSRLERAQIARAAFDAERTRVDKENLRQYRIEQEARVSEEEADEVDLLDSLLGSMAEPEKESRKARRDRAAKERAEAEEAVLRVELTKLEIERTRQAVERG